MKKTQSQAGFSLLEILIVISLLAFMIGGISKIIKNALRVQNKLEIQNNITQELNRTLDKISSDLAHTFFVSTKDFNRTNGGKNKTFFAIEKGSISDTLKMTNNNHQVVQENSHESSLSYVVYKVAEDKENKNRRNLYRAESPRVPENFRQDPPMKLFAKNIHSIKFSAWDGQKWRKEKWDSTKKETKNNIPKMVRVDILMWVLPSDKDRPKEQDNNLEYFSTIVYLNNSLDIKEVKTPSRTFKLS